MSVTTKFSAGFQWLRHNWLYLLGSLLTASLFLYKLATIPVAGKLSRPEYLLAISGGSWRYLVNNPFYLPYRALAWISRQLLSSHPLLALRLPSVLFAAVAFMATIYITRRWYGPRTAFFGFILFATSAALLHVGRLATTDIVYFASLPLLVSAHILLNEKANRFALFYWLLVICFALYVPGLLWFVLLMAVWQRGVFTEAFRELGDISWRILAVLLPMVAVVPLIYGFFKHLNISYLLSWLGLPTHMPSITFVTKNAVASVSFIFFRTPVDPSRWLSTLPLLSAFLLVSFVAGLIFYVTHLRAERTKLLIALMLISLLLLAAGGSTSRSLMVPLVYIITFGGIAYLLHFWLAMFPKNLSAKWLGISVVSLAVLLTVTLDLRHYFIAWPHNPQTRAAFIYPPPEL